MSKVLTYSTRFPSYHPKAGQPTYFVEKLLNSLGDPNNYYPCHCEDCGWMGMSSVVGGGGQIADTGDYSDIFCPKCGSLKLEGDNTDWLKESFYMGKFNPKGHTIRARHDFKPGDKFSPRIWSGVPYNSKQVIIAPDIIIEKVWDIEIIPLKKDLFPIIEIDGNTCINLSELEELSKNDGLSVTDFLNWFPKPMKGQIICWNKDINY